MADSTPHTIAADNLASYIGDMNLTYGGTFIRIDDDGRHYADVIEYIDASSAAGVDDETWINCATVPLDMARLATWRSALSCIGLSVRAPEFRKLSRTAKAVEFAYALYVYGFSDRDALDTLTDATDEQLLDDANERLAAL